MKRFLSIVSLALLAISCRKENSNEFYPYPNHELNDTNWYSSIPQAARVRQLDSIFAIHPKEDSVDCINGGTVNFDDSVFITFPTSFCSGPAAPGSGKVKIEMIQLKQKGDMIKADRPTMSYDRLLVTGGAIKLRVTYNGQELQLAQGKTITVKIFNKMSNVNTTNDMRVFYGKDDAYPVTAAQTFTWIPWTDTALNRATPVVSTSTGSQIRGYQFLSNRFGWVNCDYFSDTSQPRTKATVVLPPNFTNINTNVYAVFKTADIVAQLIPDPVTKTFKINNIYTGKVVTFVSLSYISGNLYLASKELTVGTNMNMNLTPVQVTKQQIESFLDAL